MSGQATGWVLRHGPRPDDVGADGKVYGLAHARAMRAVLGTIADAANRDGERSHPGKAAMEEGSLYSRASLARILNALLADGWIEVTEAGGGRGRSTEYRVRFERRRGSHGETVSETETGSNPEGNRLIEDAKGSQIEGKPSHGPTCDRPPTVCTTVNPNELRDARAEAEKRFDDYVWTTWPERSGKRLHRAKAVDQFVTLSLDDQRAAYRGVRHFRAAVDAGGVFGVPDLFRWLRDRQWVDWQEPAVVTPTTNGTRPSVGEQNVARLRTGFPERQEVGRGS